MPRQEYVELSKIRHKIDNPEARQKVEQLSHLLDLRWYIDRGDYQMRYFASEPVDSAAVPLYPETFRGDRYRGLRYGVLWAINTRLADLEELGYGKLAHHLVDYDRTRGENKARAI